MLRLEKARTLRLGSDRNVYFLAVCRRLWLGLGDKPTLEAGLNDGRVLGAQRIAVGAEWWAR